MNKLMALWQGELSLQSAFWDWAVLGGLSVNVITSVLFFALLTYDYSWTALLVRYGFSMPYNVVVMVGVWRSAMRHDGPARQAEAARVTTVILMAVFSVT